MTQGNVPNGAIIGHHISVFLGDSSETISIDAAQGSSNSSVQMSHERNTHLSDGTKASYGNNGAVSKLTWVINGVLYRLGSSKNGNLPDLTEKQLILVAESFQ